MRSRPKASEFSRPNVKRYNNFLLHSLGKFIRVLSNRIINSFDKGKFNSEVFRINEIEIPIRSLANSFSGYRILQISDIHLGTWINQERLRGIVELVNNQEPDLICITGDFVTHSESDFHEILSNELRKLSAIDGVYAVFGNHDYWSDVDLVFNAINQANITILRNQVVEILKCGEKLYLAGLDDVYNSFDNLEMIEAQIPQNAPALIMVHVPDAADFVARNNKFCLQISGHTHGGQIVLPRIGTPILPPLGRKYVRGLNKINGMYQYTNCGVGTATIPIRWNCPPEITIFKLRTTTVTS